MRFDSQLDSWRWFDWAGGSFTTKNTKFTKMLKSGILWAALEIWEMRI